MEMTPVFNNSFDFTKLPEEMQQAVMAFLDTKNLGKMCQVSKAVGAMAKKVLKERIEKPVGGVFERTWAMEGVIQQAITEARERLGKRAEFVIIMDVKETSRGAIRVFENDLIAETNCELFELLPFFDSPEYYGILVRWSVHYLLKYANEYERGHDRTGVPEVIWPGFDQTAVNDNGEYNQATIDFVLRKLLLWLKWFDSRQDMSYLAQYPKIYQQMFLSTVLKVLLFVMIKNDRHLAVLGEMTKEEKNHFNGQCENLIRMVSLGQGLPKNAEAAEMLRSKMIQIPFESTRERSRAEVAMKRLWNALTWMRETAEETCTSLMVDVKVVLGDVMNIMIWIKEEVERRVAEGLVSEEIGGEMEEPVEDNQ